MTTTTFNLDTDDPTLTRLLGSLAKDPGNHDLMRVMADRLEELVSVSEEAAWLAMACRYAAKRKARLCPPPDDDPVQGWHWGNLVMSWSSSPRLCLLDAFRRLSIAMTRAGVTA